MKTRILRSLGCTVILIALVACGGGKGGDTSALLSLGAVTALYPAKGANWNDYVKNDGTDRYGATDTACDAATAGPGYNACIHGGELRTVEVTGTTSCADLTADDSLGVFDWACDESTGTVRFLSTGLKEGKHLSDLIDFAAAAWKDIAVTGYRNGKAFGTTTAAAWWTNRVSVNSSGGRLASAGTVYIVTTDLGTSSSVAADKIAVLVQPGLTLHGAGSGAYVIEASAKNYLWVEGALDAASDNYGLRLTSIGFSVLRNVEVHGGLYGVLLNLSRNNSLQGFRGDSANYGVCLMNSSANTLAGIIVSNTSSGVYLNGSSRNTLVGIAASNGVSGIYISNSPDNTLRDCTAFNNSHAGIALASSSNNNLAGITSVNNKWAGVSLQNSSGNTLSDITADNNGWDGLALSSAPSNTLHGIASAHNGNGISLNASSFNHVTGSLKLGNNASADCSVTGGGTDPGLVDFTCANNGTSDALLVTGITVSSSFAGKAASDSANASGPGGAALFDTIADWISFENPYRGWGMEGSAFPNADDRGSCAAGQNCRIWDWSLAAGDTGDKGNPVLQNVLALPTGNDTLTHTWSDLSTTTFLKNAAEVLDGAGNDNGLCESGEICLYTPNIGSYQGHGNLVSAGTFTNGTLTDITLMKYETNGR